MKNRSYLKNDRRELAYIAQGSRSQSRGSNATTNSSARSQSGPGGAVKLNFIKSRQAKKVAKYRLKNGHFGRFFEILKRPGRKPIRASWRPQYHPLLATNSISLPLPGSTFSSPGIFRKMKIYIFFPLFLP